MKLRILSIVLCLAMLVCAFASCSKKDEGEDDVITETSTRAAVTLSMYVITEDGTTSEAAEAVEKAINSMTKSKYTTKLEITYLTADEYYATVEAQLEQMKKNADPTSTDTEAAESGDETAAPVEEELVIGENGVAELKYPTLTPGQIDIIVIDDYAKYTEYVEKDYLASLESAIKGTAKKLGDYIYPATLEAAKVNGTLYGIPNNHPITTEATYITINRELAKEFGLDCDLVKSVTDLADFLAFAATKEGVTPIRNTKIEMSDVLYMGADAATRTLTSGFSLVGQYSKNATLTAPESLFANKEYKNDLLTLAKYDFEGYFGTGADEKYAVEIKTGDLAAMCADSAENEIVALSAKTLPAEQVCGTVISVSVFTDKKFFDRAIEVITYLNTNEEIRNLFQYGIEGTNYVLDEITDEVIKLTNDYNMDLSKTGNMFIAYPDAGMPMNIWEMAKKQNLVSMKAVDDIFGGFTIPADVEGETSVDFDSAKELAKASAAVKAQLDACKTYEEYEAAVNAVAETYGEVISSFITGEKTPCALYVASLS